jgi:hypothetical protein
MFWTKQKPRQSRGFALKKDVDGRHKAGHDVRLFRRFAVQFAGLLHLLVQPVRTRIVSIRPSERAEIEKYSCKISVVAKRFDHRAWLIYHRRKVVLTRAAVAEGNAQAEAAERLH